MILYENIFLDDEENIIFDYNSTNDKDAIIKTHFGKDKKRTPFIKHSLGGIDIYSVYCHIHI